MTNTPFIYVAAEPEEKTIVVYLDQKGVRYDDREQALKSNFFDDLYTVIANRIEHGDRFSDMSPADTLLFMKAFAQTHPEYLRVLIGDRDYT